MEQWLLALSSHRSSEHAVMPSTCKITSLFSSPPSSPIPSLEGWCLIELIKFSYTHLGEGQPNCILSSCKHLDMPTRHKLELSLSKIRHRQCLPNSLRQGQEPAITSCEKPCLRVQVVQPQWQTPWLPAFPQLAREAENPSENWREYSSSYKDIPMTKKSRSELLTKVTLLYSRAFGFKAISVGSNP